MEGDRRMGGPIEIPVEFMFGHRAQITADVHIQTSGDPGTIRLGCTTS